ncbi:MAG: peptidase M66 [Planctomycetes bacterium]|nr:peptidase M66 [Planctomycetota bacterium]
MSISARAAAGLIAAALMWDSMFAADPAVKPLVFNTTAPTNDLQGTLSAQVRFAQSQIVPVHPRKGDNQPHLISQRQSLLLVQLLKPDGTSPMQVTARDKAGKVLGSLSLDPPEKLPKTAYDLDGLPDETIDFTAPAAGSVISNRRDLEKLSEPEETFLHGRLRQNALVEVQTADGQWVRDIHVPSGAEFDGKFLRVRSNAGYGSTVHSGGRTVAISRGQTLLFKSVCGQWILESDLENQGIRYANDTWSCVLPADWIVPGLNLQIRQGNQSGTLTNIKVGAPTELLIHTIDIGMLTPPRDQFQFAGDPAAHREYFQTVPTSRLIVSQYAPLFLPEVTLPNGILLTDHDPSKGDWHNGNMRQSIGKELISLGIDNANYGINSTAGEGEGNHPYVVAQLAAHNSVGKYAAGIVVHGGSGGGGIVTLDDSLHNEFSHEVGHNYGLGHYVDGFRGSVHRSADQINSTWGWDADRNRFIPNFSPVRSGKDTCLEDQCQGPFDGRSFGLDAMAGGMPLSGFNRFTLYTPNTAGIIQRFLEGKAVFDANSPTGFSKWNDAKGKMEPYGHKIGSASQIAAPVNDLSEEKLASLLAEYDRVVVGMGDGNWTKNIPVPAASAANRGRTVTIDHGASYGSTLFLNGVQIAVARGFKKSYNSDGKRWKEGAGTDLTVERKPRTFGVPVTTLVGYYDPEGELKSSIYPALHGAYGFTYGDDRGHSSGLECHLLVETRDGPIRFRLANRRLSAKVMNKFHINIPETSQPKSVAVVCRGKVLDSKPIAPVAEKLSYTVHGRPLTSDKSRSD